MGALSSLNLAANSLGKLVLPEGWSKEDTWGGMPTFKHADGREQKEDPGSKPEGLIALANAIPNMGALSSFTFGDKQAVTMTTLMADANFSGKLKSYEAQIAAAFLPKCT
jgi:hypothetical protein